MIIRKDFFTVKLPEPWHRLPRDMVKSVMVDIEVVQVWVWVRKFGWFCEQKDWTR